MIESSFAAHIGKLDLFETAGAIRGYSTAYNIGQEMPYYYYVVTDNWGRDHKFGPQQLDAFIIGIETSPGGMA